MPRTAWPRCQRPVEEDTVAQETKTEVGRFDVGCVKLARRIGASAHAGFFRIAACNTSYRFLASADAPLRRACSTHPTPTLLRVEKFTHCQKKPTRLHGGLVFLLFRNRIGLAQVLLCTPSCACATLPFLPLDEYQCNVSPFFSTVLILTSTAAATDKPPAKSNIGQTVGSFSLKDYRGKSHSLADFKNRKLLVVAFLGTDCPLAKLYGLRLGKLQREFEAKGVAFVGVNSNCNDSITAISAHASKHKIDFPVLKDLGNKLADAMKAARTPEVFVLDAQRRIRYRGRIDDQYGIGYIRDKAEHTYLKDAICRAARGKIGHDAGHQTGRLSDFARADTEEEREGDLCVRHRGDSA